VNTGGFLSGLWLGVRSLVTNPVGYLTDPVQATSDLYMQDLAKQGASSEEQAAALTAYQSSGGLVYTAYSGLKKLSQGIQGVLKFILEHLGSIVLVAALVVGGYYLLKLLKVVKIK
jgi:hypothetical protein